MKTNWMKSTIHQYPYRVIVFIIAYIFLLTGFGLANEAKSIKIIDEQGSSIESFQCMVRWKNLDKNGSVRNGVIEWKEFKSEKGPVKVDINDLKESSKDYATGQPSANGLDILVMADGCAPEFIRCRFENIPDEIILEKPLTIYLEKKEKVVPGNPVILPKKYVNELLYPFMSSNQYPLKLKEVSLDKWKCNLKKGQEYVIGWKAKKGWFSKKFHGYCSESFIAKENGQVVNFEPGMPVTFQYDLSKVPDFLNTRKHPVKVILNRVGPDGERLQFSFEGEGSVKIEQAGIGRIPNLAAGTYYLTASNSPENLSMPRLYDKRKITLSSGECRIKPVYPVLDTTVEPGDVTIKGTVLDADKNPIAKKTVSLWLQQYDENKRLLPVSDTFYKPVKTNAQGKYEFKGVLPDQDVVLSLSNHSNSIFLARNSLKENAEIEVSFIVGQKNELITVGKPFPFPMVRLENDDKKDLDELKGKIVVIDIWASWCTPCIRSMPKLCELAKEMQSEEVKFITLSIDSDKQAWIKRLAENDWPVLLHTWFDGTINNHKLKYNGGIPFCVIIDEQGMVRVAGNGVDIKSELEKL